jgi:hypothetical protein
VKNPIYWVAPGERGEVTLAPDVRGFVVRGDEPGPIVWAWAVRGENDPSMAQALGELRDRLAPSALRGAVGLLLDGPPPPLGREAYPWAGPIRAISDGAAAVVLLESMLPGYQAAPHVAVDLDDRPSRQVARALGSSYLAPHLVTPPANRAIVTAPTAQWLDGEADRLSREVIDRAVRALRSLCATLGMLDEEPARPPVRVVLKAIAEVEGSGLAEPTIAPGELVRAGELVAWTGEPGLSGRRPLRAPASGVVLWIRSGRLVGGSVVGIGKLRRTLPRVLRAAQAAGTARPSVSPIDIGWCERVALPELGVERLKAKIDTGARTSALHVIRMAPAGWSSGGRPLLDVVIPSGGRGAVKEARVEVLERTLVRDSGGHAERRPVIETALALGGVCERVRLSLTDRGDMRFPMLVGRTALPAQFRVLPRRRFLLR